MPFPDDVLADEEEVVLHLRPHWRAAVRPVALLALALAVIILAWVMLPPDDGGHLAFGVVALIMLYQALRYGVVPLMIWRHTHYVLTGDRILLQHGVVNVERRDLPLNRVNDHLLSQSALDRLFGSGTLTVDSVGDQAAVLASLPHAHQVQTVLYELIEQLPEDEEEDEEPAPEVPPQRRGFFRKSSS